MGRTRHPALSFYAVYYFVMFGTHASGKAALIADVSDSGVGVSIVQLSGHGPATILQSDRMSLPAEDRATSQSVAGILGLFEQCVDKALKDYAGTDPKKAPPPPQAAYVILRAPWTRFRTAQAQESYTEPHAITKDVIGTLAKKAAASITDLDAANAFEAGVMQVFLNGYPTGNPIGKRAQIVAVTAFQSDVNQEMKRGIESVVGKLLPERTLVFRSGLRALLTVLHEVVPDIHRYSLLDIGGTATACVVVRKEMVTQSAETTEGSVTILKRIAGTGLPEEALVQLRMLAADTCSTDACKAVRESLARAEPDLAKSYGAMFAKLAERRRLPNRCLVAAPAEFLPWLQGFFERIDFAQFTATTQPLEVEALTTEHLQGIVMWKASSQRDAGLAVSAGCVNILEQNA